MGRGVPLIKLRHNAWISWLPFKKGGREHVPTARYRLCVLFDKQQNWPAEGWTLVVEPIRLFEGDRLQVAKMDFLADDAPQELITPGARFELLDGRQVVAHGLVVDAEHNDDVSRQAVEDVLLV